MISPPRLRNFNVLSHPTHANWVQIVLWELLAADVEGVEGIGAVGAVFEEVFLRLGLLLHRLVLAEAVSPTLHSCGLDGKDEVVVVLAVEVRHEALLAREPLVDEEILLVMAHRVAKVPVNDLPAVAFKLVDHDPMEILVVHGIVGAERSGIVVEDDRMVGVRSVIRTEVGNQRRNLSLELDIKRFEDVQAVALRLTAHDPVDVGIVVHTDAERLHRADVRVRAAVERRVERGKLRVGMDGVQVLLRLADYFLVAEGVEIVEIRCVILVVLLHGRIEAVVRDANFLTEDRSLERLRCEVALHLTDVLLTEKLEVFEGGILLIIYGDRAHTVERLVEPLQVIREIRGNGLVLFFERGDALLGLPNLVDSALDGVDEFRVHLVLIVQKPRALGGLRHIRENHHGMVERVMPEIRADAAVGRERFVLQFVVVDELRLVDKQPRERERGGGAGAILRDDDSHGAVVERDDVLIVGRLGDGFGERLGRFASDHIVNTIYISPPLPRSEQTGERVGKTMLERGDDDATSGARHPLHIAQDER